jgi:putative photosynthetic complex assembly protein 2
MLGHGLTFVFTVLLWWLSTGVILMLCTLPKRTFGWSLLGGAVVMVASFYGLASSARVSAASGAYCAFLSAVALWGCLEMGFLMGYVTGPRKIACPADATGWRRFRLAVTTLVYRQATVALAAVAVVWLTRGGVNQIGAYTFLILLAMRVSAELNIFLGVPYLPDELLPERLAYLKSYFRARPASLFFPVSVISASLLAIILGQRALGAEGAEAIGFALLFTLLALAILEHFFMIVPLPDAALWRWARQLALPKPLD